jgi:ATP-binding cassette subfamily B protein RaxB
VSTEPGQLQFGRSGHLPEIHQAATTECGLACLAMIASYHGRQSDLNTLRLGISRLAEGRYLANRDEQELFTIIAEAGS